MRNQDKYPDLLRFYLGHALLKEFKGVRIGENETMMLLRLSLKDKLRTVNFYDLFSRPDAVKRSEKLHALGLISYVPVGRWSLTPEGEYFLFTLDKAIRDRVNLDNLELLTKKRIRGDKKIKKRYKRGA